MLKHLIELLYPHLCICCNEEQPIRGQRFCLDCKTELPFTTHFEHHENKLIQKFWGLSDVEFAAAALFFDKGGRVREMIHNLKYHNKTSVAKAMGKYIGEQLCQTFAESIPFDAIIPVPIHHKKRLVRGYNQSELLGRAISSVTGIPLVTDVLVKDRHTTSQTNKSREERFNNVHHSFRCTAKAAEYKHFLIVDDVVTTGATLDSCIHHLQNASHAKCSIVCLAMART